MLRFINQFNGMDVLSLQTGMRVASLSDPIINPQNLRIVAFDVETAKRKDELVLFIDDIRETGRREVIVDREDNLMALDDLVRLHELKEKNYRLKGKKIITDKKRKVGKVSDYIVDDSTYFIMKIHAAPSIAKSLVAGNLIIDRNQILEVNDKNIVVKDSVVEVKKPSRRQALEPTT